MCLVHRIVPMFGYAFEFINDLPDSVGIPTDIFADLGPLHQQASYPSSHLVPQVAVGNAESWAFSWHVQFGHSNTKVLRISSSKVCMS